jgi:hypothetical protein
LYIQYENKFDAVYSMQIVLENFGNVVKDNLVQLSKSESELVYQDSFCNEKSRFIDIQTISRFVDKSYTVVIKNILIFDNLKSNDDYLEFERDLKEELSKYGQIDKYLVPRPPYLRKGFGLLECDQEIPLERIEAKNKPIDEEDG